MLEASQCTDAMEVGEVTPGLFKAFKDKIDEAVQSQYEKCPVKEFYIHLWTTKEPYANNSIHIHCQNRRTRPSPYQGNDHYLYRVTDYCNVHFEWCIPRKEILQYVLKNPTRFDKDYVNMLRRYVGDKIETLSDYLVDGRIA